MKRKYISVDIESTGRTPGKYSMIALGAAVVGDTKKTFYRELKPINNNFSLEALKIGSLGLKCLEDLKKEDPIYDPESKEFQPKKVLELLDEMGQSPYQVMPEFRLWIGQVARDQRPVMAAAPIAFDGMYVHWYFDNFLEGDQDPFGHGGDDINSWLRGATNDPDHNLTKLGLRKNKPKTHNALEDAMQQAEEFEFILGMDAFNRSKAKKLSR